jgi:prepilin-type N-terminal cleavage/methylation domain-containing protein
MPANRRRRGFTLVEMLISMALLAMIMVAACLAVQAAGAAHSYNSEKGELVARARGVLDWIALDVRRSDSVTLNNDKSLTVTMINGWIRTYAWDGTQGGHVTYSETDPDTGVPSTPVVLGVPSDPDLPATQIGYVDEFHVEQVGAGCRVQILLHGQRANCQAAITATPLKSLY